MSKKNSAVLTVVISCITVVACIALAVCAIVWILNRDDGAGFSHLQSGGLNITLVRERLISNSLDENGKLKEKTDENAADFSKPTKQNVFGIENGTVIIPNSYYSADMLIGTPDRDCEFAYWLAVIPAETGELSERLKVTVTVGGEVKKSETLNGVFKVGGETDPIATVTHQKQSRFNIKIEFESAQSGDNSAQNQRIYFDLTVYAVRL